MNAEPALKLELLQLPVHCHVCDCGRPVECPGPEECNALPGEPLRCDDCAGGSRVRS